jgi:hypothetical protein
VSEVQNQQQGGQQQTLDAAGQATDQVGRTVKGVQNAVGGLTGTQEQGGEGALGGVTDQAQGAAGQVTGQAQDVANQATDKSGQLVGKTWDAAGGLIGGQGAGQGSNQGTGQSGEQEMDDYSYSDSDAETVVNDKTPKGILGQLLNLDILPPPQSDTTTLESGDGGEYYGPK